MFAAPYIVIDRENRGIATAADHDTARALFRERADAASIVGTARPGVEVVDIDPADTNAPAEAGIAASEDLRDWIAAYGLPYLRRASGRPGGQHLIAVVPEHLVDAFAAYVAETAAHHGVAATLRVPRTLRLLTAPHRHGLASPLLDGTLRPADLPRGEKRSPRRAPVRSSGKARHPATGSPSESAYRRTCAAIRRGLSLPQAWALVSECQVVQRGIGDYRKYMWFPAITAISAERGLDESTAWKLAREASSARVATLGRDGWRERYWLPAVARAADATQPRARRLTDDPTAQESNADDPAEQASRLEAVRTAMHAASTDLIAQFRPQRQRSIRAVIDALAVVIAGSRGSIGLRDLAEQACVSKGVTVQVKADLTEHGVIAVAKEYAGGAADCHSYALGKRAEEALPEIETTRWYTPTPRTYGKANPQLMHLHHVRERTRWELRCTLAEATRESGEKWATSQHPAAKAARSLWAQRSRWEALPEEVQEERRKRRRSYLGRLPDDERRRWFDWLNQRDCLAQAALRARARTATAEDRAVLAAAPVTVHLGMRDRSWYDGSASRAAPAQLLLFRQAA